MILRDKEIIIQFPKHKNVMIVVIIFMVNSDPNMGIVMMGHEIVSQE